MRRTPGGSVALGRPHAIGARREHGQISPGRRAECCLTQRSVSVSLRGSLATSRCAARHKGGGPGRRASSSKRPGPWSSTEKDWASDPRLTIALPPEVTESQTPSRLGKNRVLPPTRSEHYGGRVWACHDVGNVLSVTPWTLERHEVPVGLCHPRPEPLSSCGSGGGTSDPARTRNGGPGLGRIAGSTVNPR